MIRAACFAAVCLAAAADSAIADDVMAGRKVFRRCEPCHSITGKINKNGPYLVGVIGRPVATADGFTYSRPMWAFGKTGAVWDEATLDTFLKGPSDLVKGTNMTAPPVRKDSERADLIAYLKAHM